MLISSTEDIAMEIEDLLKKLRESKKTNTTQQNIQLMIRARIIGEKGFYLKEDFISGKKVKKNAPGSKSHLKA